MSELERPQNPDETISKLHHMSTTAGMGAGDYVEINPLAIASVVLAATSLLGIVFLPFLTLGALGLITGNYSLIKIHKSNGTQGGKLIAALGIFFSLAISGGEGARQYAIHAKNQRDSRTITALITQLGDALVKEDRVKARNLFSDEFKQIVSQETFNESSLSRLTKITDFGKFQGLETKGPFNFSASGEGIPIGATNIQVRYEKAIFEFTTLYALQDPQGNWKLYNLVGVFNSVPKLQI